MKGKNYEKRIKENSIGGNIGKKIRVAQGMLAYCGRGIKFHF